MPKQHWSDILSCRCGKRFKSYSDEAQHRHNFPALCRGVPVSSKRKTKKKVDDENRTTPTE